MIQDPTQGPQSGPSTPNPRFSGVGSDPEGGEGSGVTVDPAALSEPPAQLEPGNPYSTEVRLRQMVEQLRVVQQQLDVEFLQRMSAAQQMHAYSAEQLQQLSGEDNESAAAMLEHGVATAGEQWRRPGVADQYRDVLADLEASDTSGANSESFGRIREQIEQSSEVGAALNEDEDRLRKSSEGILRDRGKDRVYQNLAETMVAELTFETAGKSGDRRQRAISDVIDRAKSFVEDRYTEQIQPSGSSPWDNDPMVQVQGRGRLPKSQSTRLKRGPGGVEKEQYEALLMRGVLTKIRDEMRGDSRLDPTTALGVDETLANEITRYGSMLIPIGMGAGIAGKAAQTAFKGVRRGTTRALGMAGARVLGKATVMGTQAATLMTAGFAMRPDTGQQEFIEIDAGASLPDDASPEQINEVKRAAEAAVRFKNGLSMGTMMPMLSLLGPLAGVVGKRAGAAASRIGARTGAVASRVGAGAAMGAQMPAIMELAGHVADTLARATEGTDLPLLEEVGTAARLGLIVDEDPMGPVREVFRAAAGGDWKGMADAALEYGRRVAPASIAFGGFNLLAATAGVSAQGIANVHQRRERRRVILDLAELAKKDAVDAVQKLTDEELGEIASGASREQLTTQLEALIDDEAGRIAGGEEPLSVAEKVDPRDLDEAVAIDRTRPSTDIDDVIAGRGFEELDSLRDDSVQRDPPGTLRQAIQDADREVSTIEAEDAIRGQGELEPSMDREVEAQASAAEAAALRAEEALRDDSLSEGARAAAAEEASMQRMLAADSRGWLSSPHGAVPNPEDYRAGDIRSAAHEAEGRRELLEAPGREERVAGAILDRMEAERPVAQKPDDETGISETKAPGKDIEGEAIPGRRELAGAPDHELEGGYAPEWRRAVQRSHQAGGFAASAGMRRQLREAGMPDGSPAWNSGSDRTKPRPGGVFEIPVDAPEFRGVLEAEDYVGAIYSGVPRDLPRGGNLEDLPRGEFDNNGAVILDMKVGSARWGAHRALAERANMLARDLTVAYEMEPKRDADGYDVPTTRSAADGKFGAYIDEARAAFNGAREVGTPGAFAEFREAFSGLIQGAESVTARYYDPGAKLVRDIERHQTMLDRPSEAGFVRMGSPVDAMRRVAGFFSGPSAMDHFIREALSDPARNVSKVRGLLHRLGVSNPIQFGGRMALDGIATLTRAAGTYEQHVRSIFGRNGVMGDIKEGSDQSKALFHALNDGPDSKAWKGLDSGLREKAKQLRSMFEGMREALVEVHPQMRRMRQEADWASDMMQRREERFQELTKEFEDAKAARDELAARDDADPVDVEAATKQMRRVQGARARLSGSQKRMAARRQALGVSMRELRDEWGFENYVHHSVRLDADPDATLELFEGPRDFGGSAAATRRKSDVETRLQTRRKVSAGIAKRRKGALEAEGLLAEDAVRSVWRYIATFPVYAHRMEFLGKWDEFLYGRLDIGRVDRVERPDGSSYERHEALGPHEEVIYDGRRARSFGRMSAVESDQGLTYNASKDAEGDQGVLLWLGDREASPSSKQLADPTFVARYTAVEKSETGVSVAPLLQFVPVHEAQNEFRLWRDGWYGEMLAASDDVHRGNEVAAARRLADWVENDIVGGTRAIMHGADDLLTQAQSRGEALVSVMTSLMSMNTLGGPTNVRNAVTAGVGGAAFAYFAMGRLPRRRALGAMRAFGKLEKGMRSRERGLIGAVADRLFDDGGAPAPQVMAKDGRLTMSAELDDLLPKPDPEAIERGGKDAEIEAGREAIAALWRSHVMGGNRGDQLGRNMLTAMRGSRDARDGRVDRPGRLDGWGLFQAANETFWKPFNIAERYARALPFIDVYMDSRLAGASADDATAHAFAAVHQTQMVYSRASKPALLNHPLGRLFGALSTWSVHAQGRVAALPKKQFAKLFGSMAAFTFAAQQFGFDPTRMLMSQSTDLDLGFDEGEYLTGLAGGVGTGTEDDPLGLQPKGWLADGTVPNLPLPLFFTGPGPFADVAADLARMGSSFAHGDWSRAEDMMGRLLRQLDPIKNANWMRRLEAAMHAEEDAAGNLRYVDAEGRVKKDFSHVDSRAMAWLSQQLPLVTETRGWISAVLEDQSRRREGAMSAQLSRRQEDVADSLLQFEEAKSDAERELARRNGDEALAEVSRLREGLGKTGDLGTQIRSAVKRREIDRSLRPELRVIRRASTKAQQVRMLVQVLRDESLALPITQVQTVLEKVLRVGSRSGLSTVPDDLQEQLAEALEFRQEFEWKHR